MDYFENAKALVQYSGEQLPGIEATYRKALSDKEVKSSLLIGIKNLMENLRSALDYSAHGLFNKYGSSSKANPRVYFPYAFLGQTQAEFRNKKRVETCIPGLTSSRPDIVARLESYQEFANPNNRWLPVFMELNNENKHQQLTPQTHREFKQLGLSSGGASIQLGEGASISMGPGTSIQIGNMVVRGNQSFDVNNPPKTFGRGTVEVITWVSFHFSSNDEPVLQLLKQAVDGVDDIVSELSQL